jgi:hypothetical protein
MLFFFEIMQHIITSTFDTLDEGLSPPAVTVQVIFSLLLLCKWGTIGGAL